MATKAEPIMIDAAGEVLGRLAVRVANILRGKDQPTFLPYKLSGGKVVVVNAEKIRVTGRKLQQKIYYRHSGWPRGLRSISLGERLATEPEKVIEDAVRGMLPKNRLRNEWMKMLTVVQGDRDNREPRTVNSNDTKNGSQVTIHGSQNDKEVHAS